MSQEPREERATQIELSRLRQDKEQLDEQVKLLVRLENRLHRSRLERERELKRIEALNRFALRARRLTNASDIMGQAIELLLSVFPFDRGAGWARTRQGTCRLRATRSVAGMNTPGPAHDVEVDLAPLMTEPLSIISADRPAAHKEAFRQPLEAAFGSSSMAGDNTAILCVGLPSLGDDLVGALLLWRFDATRLPPHTPLPTEGDFPFLRLVGAHAGAAVRGAQLTDELHEALDGKRAFASTVVDAQEDERQRVARELHDAVGQDLVALRMDVDWIADHADDAQSVRRLAEKLAGRLGDTLGSLRRIVQDLRPPMLDDLGVAAAVAAYGATISQRWGVSVDTEIAPNLGELTQDLATALYRIAQESINNAARHADASTVQVRLEKIDGELRLTVSDDGHGIPEGRLHAPNSYGLVGMRERAEQLGGRLLIAARPSGGTAVTAMIPSPA